jgi:hypothetical protein
LDNAINSLSPSPIYEGVYFDNPGLPISNGNNHETDPGSFQTFLMYNPNTSGAISVPLKLIAWDWSGVADASGGWNLSVSSKHITINDQDTTTFPIWTNIIVVGGFGYTTTNDDNCR